MVFSQLLALAVKVASLLRQEEHYALWVAKTEPTLSRVEMKLVMCAVMGCFARMRNAPPQALD